MRSLMLASAAFIVSAGVACAQSAPAPTGATNAPIVSNAPGASPGNTSPSTPIGTATPAPQPPMASSASPAPDGAISSPPVTQAGTSPGRTAPATGQASAMAAPQHQSAMTTHKHWGMGHNMTMPEDADARTYLHIASDAIRHNNKVVADDALSHAETRLLTREVPQSSTIPVDDSDSVTAIEHARQAVASGDMSVAMTDTRDALHTMHGGMMTGPMGASSDAAPAQAPGGMTPTPPTGSVSATAGGM